MHIRTHLVAPMPSHLLKQSDGAQESIPEFIKAPVIMNMHKAIRFHKKNVARMKEKLAK